MYVINSLVVNRLYCSAKKDCGMQQVLTLWSWMDWWCRLRACLARLRSSLG